MPETPKVLMLLLGRQTLSRADREYLLGITRYTQLHGSWNLFMEPPFYKRSKKEPDPLVCLKKWNPDGIFVKLGNKKQAQDLVKSGLPVIANNVTGVIPKLHRVNSNPVEVGKMCASHLLEQGFRRFAYCGYDDEQCRFYCTSFRQKLAEADFETNVYKPPKSQRMSSWIKEQIKMIDWIKSLSRPVGIMTNNDYRGQQVLDCCKTLGLNVPEEIAVISVGNDDLICNMTEPPLSSVEFNYKKAGYEAAELLDKLMSGKKIKTQQIIIHALYIKNRQSTDILAMENDNVREAVHYIREHIDKNIQTQEVAEAVGVTRQFLHKQFIEVLGRSVHDEISHIRISRAIPFLVETNMSVAKIASILGFSDSDHLARYFEREKGLTPLAYRKKYGYGILKLSQSTYKQILNTSF